MKQSIKTKLSQTRHSRICVVEKKGDKYILGFYKGSYNKDDMQELYLEIDEETYNHLIKLYNKKEGEF